MLFLTLLSHVSSVRILIHACFARRSGSAVGKTEAAAWTASVGPGIPIEDGLKHYLQVSYRIE
jgi:hypothetical protein